MKCTKVYFFDLKKKFHSIVSSRPIFTIHRIGSIWNFITLLASGIKFDHQLVHQTAISFGRWKILGARCYSDRSDGTLAWISHARTPKYQARKIILPTCPKVSSWNTWSPWIGDDFHTTTHLLGYKSASIEGLTMIHFKPFFFLSHDSNQILIWPHRILQL